MTRTRASRHVLVTGADGQVGTELTAANGAHGLSVTALSRNLLDITDADAIAGAIAAHKPDIVINAAAYTAVDKAESEAELANAVNARGPGLLGLACDAAQIPLFHISTDYVFDGSAARAWREDDPVNPLGVYGRSKAEGEAALRQATPCHIILRTAWIFSAHGGNFVKTMLRLAAERDRLSVVDDQSGNPTSATDIARTLLQLASTSIDRMMVGETPPWGTYHFCNAGVTSWCGFARAIMKGSSLRGGPSVPVTPITTAEYPTPAKRPANSALDCDKLKTVFGIEPRPWEFALDDVLDQLVGPRV
ncbi:dTDP-4-dehydrorhamnose reductase [Parvibaculum sp.]|uniref:dTDP-4-dehydrorhamnose reductase n=1 Tax=Parvibaculum sp. TaxID=2024848 RepID=UPI001B12A79C|nr:dTDP-4-dehydrorhamnose reductase [Parvibaculum sp.]MBO6634886.1 dTDP-4-dehydrorhamnose reductase [Parvibaculum sp.]MBO6679289.1 dTDP-4-dehydrorhamnose reductase [Parvibaculum sp.]MBO6685438.1 dTDP-4-dehydrorhamnose reductase [Parvibaculum sp.]MBO6906194.1 dTDP-4-dehydrorhamnose reductase [Parvibaculum sp.]